MMTRLSAVAAVVAASALAKQAAAMDYTSPPEDPLSNGGEGEEAMHLGCFHDNKGDRVLGDKTTSSDMTTKVCLDHCTELGAAFMATQYGFECWCSPDGGLDYNRHYDIVGEDAVCDMDCLGDATETCGGFDSFDLYRLAPALTCSTPVEPYEQCGGLGHTGSTCCTDGYACTSMGAEEGCYLQCRPSSTETTPPPTATTSMEEPTPSPDTMEPVDPTAEPTRPPTTPEAPPTPSPVAAETPGPEPEITPGPVEAPTAEPVPETPAPQPVASPEPEPQPVGGGQYGTTFTGDGTYYGSTTGGNCAYKENVPGMYDGMIPMALNGAQYDNSMMCGACLEGTANGNGSGANPIPSTYKGYIHDSCGGCAEGDLDFSVSGDGRWDIEWEFVPCPGESVTFEFEGSNDFFWKIQPRGTMTPVETLTINGVAAARQSDNHFILEGSFGGAQTVAITTVAGVTQTFQVSL